MTLDQFLAFLLTSGGTGAATYALIEFGDKLAPLSADFKFYASIVLSFVLPLVAYGVQVGLNISELNYAGVFAALAVGWVCSQLIHRVMPAAGQKSA